LETSPPEFNPEKVLRLQPNYLNGRHKPLVSGDRYESDPGYRKEVRNRAGNFRAWNIKQELIRFMCPDFAGLENARKFYSLTGKFLLSS